MTLRSVTDLQATKKNPFMRTKTILDQNNSWRLKIPLTMSLKQLLPNTSLLTKENLHNHTASTYAEYLGKRHYITQFVEEQRGLLEEAKLNEDTRRKASLVKSMKLKTGSPREVRER